MIGPILSCHTFQEITIPFGLGVGQRCPMLDLLVSAELPEVMVILNLCAQAALEAIQGELTPVIGQELLNTKRGGQQTPLQKVGGRLLVLAFTDKKKRLTGRPIYSHEAVALLASSIGR